MPELTNARREAFAHHYAESMRAADSVVMAGYGRQNAYGQAQALLCSPDVAERIRELRKPRLKALDITAQRTLLELARVSFADIRGVVDPQTGTLKPVAELDDDVAASISGITVETRNERVSEVDLATGEVKQKLISVTVTKIKRYDKVPALNILAKHFKLVGDEGDGVNALASALADRLKGARRRVPVEIEDAKLIEREHAPTDDSEHAGPGEGVS